MNIARNNLKAINRGYKPRLVQVWSFSYCVLFKYSDLNHVLSCLLTMSLDNSLEHKLEDLNARRNKEIPYLVWDLNNGSLIL